MPSPDIDLSLTSAETKGMRASHNGTLPDEAVAILVAVYIQEIEAAWTIRSTNGAEWFAVGLATDALAALTTINKHARDLVKAEHAALLIRLDTDSHNFAARTKRMVDEEEVKKIRARAEGGDGDAMFKLGKCYAEGEKGIAVNPEEAVGWFQRGHDASHVTCTAVLGRYYLEGAGAEKNTVYGMHLCSVAADRGS